MSIRDIQVYVRELYCIEVSPDLASAVTDSVIDEVAPCRSGRSSDLRDLFCDALQVKIRDEGLVRNKALCPAIGMRLSGHKEMRRL